MKLQPAVALDREDCASACRAAVFRCHYVASSIGGSGQMSRGRRRHFTPEVEWNFLRNYSWPPTYMTFFWTVLGRGLDRGWTNIGFSVQYLSSQPKFTSTQIRQGSPDSGYRWKVRPAGRSADERQRRHGTRNERILIPTMQ